MVSSLILFRSLRLYILKQFFFSISVNSGFRNIYLAAIFSHYSPRFQRIIVKYPYSSRPKQTHTHIHTHSPPPPPGSWSLGLAILLTCPVYYFALVLSNAIKTMTITNWRTYFYGDILKYSFKMLITWDISGRLPGTIPMHLVTSSFRSGYFKNVLRRPPGTTPRV